VVSRTLDEASAAPSYIYNVVYDDGDAGACSPKRNDKPTTVLSPAPTFTPESAMQRLT